MEQTPRPTATTTQRVLRSYPVRLIGTIVLVVAAITIAARMGLLTDEPNLAAAPDRPATAPAANTPGQISDGVWIVGTDVQPGTYRSAGPVDGYCMWSRHSSVSGGPFDDIIASDGRRDGQVVVTIAATDALFRTSGCAPFSKVG